MISHRLHLPSYLQGFALMQALLWFFASWRWALVVTLFLLPWVFAWALARIAAQTEETPPQWSSTETPYSSNGTH